MRHVTRAELEAFQRDRCSADGGAAMIVRSDNHRELLRQSTEELTRQCPTEAELDHAARASSGLMVSGIARRFRCAAETGCRKPHRCLRRHDVKLGTFDAPGWEAAGDNPAACFKLAFEGARRRRPRFDSR